MLDESTDAADRHAFLTATRRRTRSRLTRASEWTFMMTGVTYAAHPTSVPPSRAWPFWYLCFLGPMECGALLLLVASVMAARAFPTRPVSVGALCGLAAGVMADPGWRLTCWITSPGHVPGAHALAVMVLTAAGGTIGAIADRPRLREIRESSRNP